MDQTENCKRVNGCIIRGRNSAIFILPPVSIGGGGGEGGEGIPKERISYPMTIFISFWNSFFKQKLTKVIPHCMKGRKHECVPNHLMTEK